MSSNKRTGKLSKDGFPHNFLDSSLDMSITDVELQLEDEIDIPTDAIEIVNSDQRLSLEAAPKWDTVNITATLNIPEKVYNTLPAEERGEHAPENIDAEAPPVRFILAIRSSKTILRRRKTDEDLSIDVTEAGEREIKFELACHEIAGDVEVKPYLVRSKAQSVNDAYAMAVGDRLASGEKWTVRVDRPDDEGGFLDPIIEDFDRPGFPDDEHLHYLKFETPSTPKLFLNAQHPKLVEVLNKEGTWGANARFRDLLFDYIEQSVWQELLFRTAKDIDMQTGEPQHPWQEDVLSLFAEDLFDAESDEEETAIQMAEYANSKDDLDILVHEINNAIQMKVDHPDTALSLLQEGINND